jgi:hypothetical protein
MYVGTYTQDHCPKRIRIQEVSFLINVNLVPPLIRQQTQYPSGHPHWLNIRENFTGNETLPAREAGKS